LEAVTTVGVNFRASACLECSGAGEGGHHVSFLAMDQLHTQSGVQWLLLEWWQSVRFTAENAGRHSFRVFIYKELQIEVSMKVLAGNVMLAWKSLSIQQQFAGNQWTSGVLL